MLRVRCLRPIALCALVVLVCAFPLHLVAADDPPGGLTTDGRPIPVDPEVIARNQAGVAVRATRISTPMVIDGQLDESVYSRVKPMTEFVQQDPHEGAPVSEHTEAWVLYDCLLYTSPSPRD